LRQCLDGFVMQQTTFPFEAIIHDDASTDGSAAIIREYAEKYSDIIKPVYETENQYSKHDGSLSRIMNAAAHPKSKYFAVCEGDDYWTDPHKLQLQVDFLESHPDYSFSVHEYNVWNEVKKEFEPHQLEVLKGVKDNLTLTLDDYVTRVFFTKTLTNVYRRSALENSKYSQYDPSGFDWMFFYALMTQGKCYLFNRVMGVYRVQPNSVTASANLQDLYLRTREAMLSIAREEKTEQSREFVFNYLKTFAFSVYYNGQFRMIIKYFRYLGLKRALLLTFVEPIKRFKELIDYKRGKRESAFKC
jgi:glycosyltransferase involved in cell wall biosynthesis